MNLVKKVNLDNIHYDKKENTSNYITYFSLMYNNNFLFLKSPYIYIYESLNFTSIDSFFFISFRGIVSNNNLYDFFNNIKDVEYKVKNDFVNKQFVSSLIIVNNDIYNTRDYDRLKVYISNNLQIFFKNQLLSLDDIDIKEIFKKNNSIRCIISPVIIWFSGQQYGCKWEIIKCFLN